VTASSVHAHARHSPLRTTLKHRAGRCQPTIRPTSLQATSLVKVLQTGRRLATPSCRQRRRARDPCPRSFEGEEEEVPLSAQVFRTPFRRRSRCHSERSVGAGHGQLVHVRHQVPRYRPERYPATGKIEARRTGGAFAAPQLQLPGCFTRLNVRPYERGPLRRGAPGGAA